jgi:hypothetical protein
MELVCHILVTHSHASGLAHTCLLLIYVLMYEVNQLLVEKAVLVGVLEEKVKKRTLLIEFKVEFVDHDLQNFLEVLR